MNGAEGCFVVVAGVISGREGGDVEVSAMLNDGWAGGGQGCVVGLELNGVEVGKVVRREGEEVKVLPLTDLGELLQQDPTVAPSFG